MQNRYAGDVGDFGKLGMLRKIALAGLSIGVNWYLVPDEHHNEDGKHIAYLQNPDFYGCDEVLLGQLGRMVYENQRSVSALERLDLLPNARYYHHELDAPGTPNGDRNSWHKQALNTLSPCDIVFLDPDNGMLVKSVSPTSKKSNKYVFLEELADYYAAGKSVIFYNHRSRTQESEYLDRFCKTLDNERFPNAQLKGLKFVRGTIRDYFFVVHSTHDTLVERAISELLSSKWNCHFKQLDLSQS